MRVLILGIDGYLGWALKSYLEERGHDVVGFDNHSRRRRVIKIGSDSLFPIDHHTEIRDLCLEGSLDAYRNIDAVVDFAEQPSAPYSMMGEKEAVKTQYNNIIGTMRLLWWLKKHPQVHLIKLGTMGVYGTPNDGFSSIPEEDGPIAYDPGSIYHISKAADSINIRKACGWWGLNATDLHQGIVYGHLSDTRFDYDQYFGTVVNRFLAQAAIEFPLTVYGKGDQTRGYINIKDTMRCIELALLNPAKGYRVFNQFTEIYSVNQIAELVQEISGVSIGRILNPRKELEQHYYNAIHARLPELGLNPHFMKDELPALFEKVKLRKDFIKKDVIIPTHSWV